MLLLRHAYHAVTNAPTYYQVSYWTTLRVERFVIGKTPAALTRAATGACARYGRSRESRECSNLIADADKLRQRLAQAGQDHCLAGVQNLAPGERRQLLNQLGGLDFDQLAYIHKQSLTAAAAQ